MRRYGFHGISYEYIARQLRSIDPDTGGGRTIAAHLGNGASLCAMAGGRSIDTTMGFTALDGLVMGTRCGALDPGAVLYLFQQKGMTAREVEHLLYSESGLLGVSGISSDMRALLGSETPAAGEAIELFVWQIARQAALSRPRSGVSTHSCSLPGSARIRLKFAPASPVGSAGSAWTSTRTRTSEEMQSSARRPAVSPSASSRPMRKG